MRKKPLYLVVTVVEPLLYDHRSPEGPFYAAGSRWLTYFENKLPLVLRHVANVAKQLRKDGYTVHVTAERL